MALTPKSASDSFIAHLAEMATTMAKASVDPLLQEPKGLVRHRDLPMMRVQIDPTIPVVKVARGLATEGLCIKRNIETGDMFLTYATEFCRHGIEIKDDETYPAVCENCVDEHGAAMAEEAVK